jgi:hypothetical protein
MSLEDFNIAPYASCASHYVTNLVNLWKDNPPAIRISKVSKIHKDQALDLLTEGTAYLVFKNFKTA